MIDCNISKSHVTEALNSNVSLDFHHVCEGALQHAPGVCAVNDT